MNLLLRKKVIQKPLSTLAYSLQEAYLGSHAQDHSADEPRKRNFDKEVKEAAARMSSDMDGLIRKHFVKEIPDEALLKPEESPKDIDKENNIHLPDDWELIQLSSDSDEDDSDIVSEDEFEEAHHTQSSNAGDAFLLRITNLTGPVLGLSFNKQYANVLAAAAYGDKLKVFHIGKEGTYQFADGSLTGKQSTNDVSRLASSISGLLASANDAGKSGTLGKRIQYYLGQGKDQMRNVLKCIGTQIK